MSIIEIKNVSKIYQMGSEKVVALDDINLTFEKGKTYCIFGPSGSGKSTLLNMIAGLEKPSKGNIIIKNNNIERFSEKQLAYFRQRFIGFVFQSYNLLPTLTALENVALPLIFKKVPKKIRNERAMKMLAAVGLTNRAGHKPGQMSGGQQQRVSIARAFINNPDVVFADEPTGNLDTKTSIEMMDLITDIAKKQSLTLIIVTHNLELACYANETIKIRDGRVFEIEKNPAVGENSIITGDVK